MIEDYDDEHGSDDVGNGSDDTDDDAEYLDVCLLIIIQKVLMLQHSPSKAVIALRCPERTRTCVKISQLGSRLKSGTDNDRRQC
eukprot:9946246-Karenia_brevis.AAC.1